MHMAHTNWQRLTWSERMKAAWRLQGFVTYLSCGFVRFAFIKSDGSMRYALGTRHLALIPHDKRPSGTKQARIDAGIEQPNYTAIPYFDIEKQEWRSFTADRLCEIRDAYNIYPYPLAHQVLPEEAYPQHLPERRGEQPVELTTMHGRPSFTVETMHDEYDPLDHSDRERHIPCCDHPNDHFGE